MRNFKNNFNNLVTVYGRTVLGFEDRWKMQFFTHVDLVKSDMARGALEKVYEKQKFFLEAIQQDYTSSFLYLDSSPAGFLLPMIREMLLSIKSNTFLMLPLFYSIKRI